MAGISKITHHRLNGKFSVKNKSHLQIFIRSIRTEHHSDYLFFAWKNLSDQIFSFLFCYCLDLRAIRHEQIYACCLEVYIDLTFTCTMKRKPLFYVINLIVPCLNISILAIFVFLLPSDSNQKITLSVSILVILLVFYLLLIELIPPTSIVIPLLGKYLLFTLVLVNLSIGITIFTLNIHFRRDSPFDLSPWLRKFLLVDLPKLVWMERPKRFDLLRLSHQEFNSIRDETQRNLDPKMIFLQQASEHISFIVDRLRKVQREKEVKSHFNLDSIEIQNFRSSRNGVLSPWYSIEFF